MSPVLVVFADWLRTPLAAIPVHTELVTSTRNAECLGVEGAMSEQSLPSVVGQGIPSTKRSVLNKKEVGDKALSNERKALTNCAAWSL